MKFQSLKITNFLTIGDAASISLDGKGLVLIQGANEDDPSALSNGAGKSSIPDALCWVLYGTTARGETGDAVVNNVAKKNTCVSVLIEDGDTLYRIVRYRKDKEHKNQTFIHASTKASPVWVDMSKGTEKETQEVINQVMGCSFDVFMAAIYAGQEEMPDLPKMTDKQLKLLIEEAAGVERLEEAYAIARSELLNAKTKLENLMSKRESAKNGLASLRARSVAMKLEFDAFEDARNEKRRKHQDQASALKDAMKIAAQEVLACDEKTLAEERKRIDEQLAGHSEIQEARQKAQSVVNDEGFQLKRCADGIAVATDNAKLLKAKLDNAETEVMKPCPACGKPGGDDHDVEAFRAHVKGELVRALEVLVVLKKKMEEVHKPALAGAQEKLAAIVLPDVSAITTRRSAIDEELGRIAGLKSKVALMKKDYDIALERASLAMTEANPHLSGLSMLGKAEEEGVAAISSVDDDIRATELEVEICNDVVKVFGPAGVRAHILDTVTPFLNERTADYLSALSDGNITAVWSTLSSTAKGDLKEKFNIEVENDKGAKSFKGLSGGEKRKVRLATMLALQDLVASRATKPIDLWIGDEIDDALDAAGLERLMGVLERKARERGTVLVISHNDLNAWIDQTLIVTKCAGISNVSGCLVE